MSTNNQRDPRAITVESATRYATGTPTTTENIAVQSVCVPHPEDPTRRQWMSLSERSSIFAMWSREDEDIYTTEDGEPV